MQGLTPQVLQHAAGVQQRMHLLHKHLVEVLCDAIELWGVMDSEPVCSACIYEVLVKCGAEVFAATV